MANALGALAGVLALVQTAAGQFRQEVWITVTNVPVTNASLTLNSDTRTWQTNASAVRILVTNTVATGQAASNLYAHLVAYPFSAQTALRYGTNTNDVVVTGGTNVVLAASQLSNWCQFRYTTSAVYSAFAVVTPYTVQSNTLRAWQMSMLSTQLWLCSTASAPAGALLLTNFPSLVGRETVGNKRLTNCLVELGTNSGVIGLLSNGQLWGVLLSNVTVDGALGNASNGFLWGTKLSNCWVSGYVGRLTNGSMWVMTNFGQNVFSDGSTYELRVTGTRLNPYDTDTAAVRPLEVVGPLVISNALTLKNDAGGDSFYFSNRDAYVYMGNPGSFHELVFHRDTPVISYDANLWVNTLTVSNAVTLPNAAWTGSNYFGGNIALGSATVSTLVDAPGANNMLVPSNVVLHLSGPTAAWNLDSATPHWAGRYHQCRNASGYDVTIVNESGSAGSATDRILTGYGANVTLSDGSWFGLWYDSAASRWRLIPMTHPSYVVSLSVSNLSATNILAGSVTATNVGVARSNGLSIPMLTAPMASNGPGTQGQIMCDGTNIYYCIGANSWLRARLSW